MINSRLKKFSETWLLEASISDIQEAVDQSVVSYKDIVLMYLSRISMFNEKINAVLEINPDAVFIAEALDTERMQKGKRGMLHGIPILLKDNINTNDKMHTSAGSIALQENVASEDAHIVKKLREAGAVILGKVNMTEWANFMTEGMPSGYSSRGGQVMNPYGPGIFDVGGSSSGSGAAIASNFAMVAIGTETSGSILSPASSNSIVGIKPTVGLVSRSGIIPISNSQDTAGPMARSVTDAAIVLSAISGVDDTDIATKTNNLGDTEYSTFLDDKGLNGKTIGVLREPAFSYLNEEEMNIMDVAINKLRECGATIIDNIKIPSSNVELGYETLIYEFKVDLNTYLQKTSSNVSIKSLKDLINFNHEHKEQMLKYGQSLLEMSEATTGTLTEPAYIEAREKDLYCSQENGIDAVMKQYNLDAIITPNNFGAGLPAKAGYPSITVPAGYTKEGKPLGITFTASKYEEGKLLEISFSYEQATKLRKAPILN
ncbi:amidase [Lottiidibacillus patelloidae]|uniref:Amidase n=1 Tax=Lottiidibacillus patelloidae TaxID=2670334 RepID=A0A263BTH1_9BACI|nr:amidase family protein [Lottiidibacillus patelloidae]OZM56677.1 amidase [Lottiidibacillus patelloidae]